MEPEQKQQVDADLEPLAHCLTCGRQMPVSRMVNTYALLDAGGATIALLWGCWSCAALGCVPVALERKEM